MSKLVSLEFITDRSDITKHIGSMAALIEPLQGIDAVLDDAFSFIILLISVVGKRDRCDHETIWKGCDIGFSCCTTLSDVSYRTVYRFKSGQGGQRRVQLL